MSDGNQETGISSTHDEDSSDDGLWNEFENCATSVTHLFRNSNWRTLQSAAASTTQLYKHGLESRKRSFDRGFSKGRIMLAREISSLCRYKNKVDVRDVVALLSKYDLLPSATTNDHRRPSGVVGGQSPRQPREIGQMDNSGAASVNPNAVFIFQEALAPISGLNAAQPVGASPTTQQHRFNGGGTGLGIFLQNQVCRHRKRPHSPQTAATTGQGNGGGSPAQHAFEFVSKRFKRL